MTKKKQPAIPEQVLTALPPALQMVLTEPTLPTDELAPVRDLRKLLPELRKQALWTMDHFDYKSAPRNVDQFAICVTPELNPFAGTGKCINPPCRTSATEQIARSIGLYADVSIVGDALTATLVNLSSRPTVKELFDLSIEISAIQRIAPLIGAGLFQFSGPHEGDSVCKGCLIEAFPNLDELSKTLAHDFPTTYRFDGELQALLVDLEDPFGQNVFATARLKPDELLKLSRGETSLDELFAKVYPDIVAAEVAEALLALRQAASFGGTCVSASPVAVTAARQLEGRPIPRNELLEWERGRTAVLPWLSALSMTQLVQLRQEAAKALPRFRSRMAKLLREHADTSTAELAMELRAEASEVEHELEMVSKKRMGLRNAMAGTGLAVTLYGMATGAINVVAGAGLTLLNLLASLHTPDQHSANARETIKTKPGYVLLKAKQILAHAKQE